jgi:DNA-binding NarL/FixJ family response regulator
MTAQHLEDQAERRIPVWVRAFDPLSQFGLLHALRDCPEIDLISDDELAARPSVLRSVQGSATRRTAPPVVALVAVDALDAAAVHVLRAATQQGCRIVLVGNCIDDEALLTAVELGVSAVLRRTEATAERIAGLVQAAAEEDGSLPPDLLGRLLGQVRAPAAPHVGSTLSDREAQVLRLVADGRDTQEIARTLSYSERTVKNVLHDITSRLNLRNRSHAVAYALREGLI